MRTGATTLMLLLERDTEDVALREELLKLCALAGKTTQTFDFVRSFPKTNELLDALKPQANDE